MNTRLRSIQGNLAGLLVIVALIPLSTAARAQTYTLTTLQDFQNSTTGIGPQIALLNGDLIYGVTAGGGSGGDGTLFTYDLSSGHLTTLVSFDGSNGNDPVPPVVRDGFGNIYGLTAYGGANSAGTLWEYSADTQTLTTLTSFTGQSGNGYSPQGILIGSDGNLYGTTAYGGVGNGGTLFEYNLTSQSLSTLVNFSQTSFSEPDSGLTLGTDGDLYGSTFYGGTSGADGGIYKYSTSANTLSAAASFSGSNGANPGGKIVSDGNGNLYGFTYYGGVGYSSTNFFTGNGTLYRYNTETGSLTTLISFNGYDGELPEAVSLDSSGNLDYLTGQGGSGYNGSPNSHTGDGVLGQYLIDNDSVGILKNFDYSDGIDPATLMTASSGAIYGTLLNGGISGGGKLFELVPASSSAPEPAALALLLPTLPLLAPCIRRVKAAAARH